MTNGSERLDRIERILEEVAITPVTLPIIQRGFDHRPLHFNIWSAIFARQSARMEYNRGTVVSTSFLDWFRHIPGGLTPSQARNLDCRVVGLAHATFTLSGELVER